MILGGVQQRGRGRTALPREFCVALLKEKELNNIINFLIILSSLKFLIFRN